MYIQKIKFITVSAVMVFLSAIAAATQSGGTFEIKQSVIASGGGNASGGGFSMDGTIGQAVAGTGSTGAGFSLESGFWASGQAAMTTRRSPFDFDGDNKTDVSVFR